jgi:putative hydrolase of HD superfamily
VTDPASIRVPDVSDDALDRLSRQLEFVQETEKLKRVLRQNLLLDGSRRENSAEHSWSLGLFAMVFAEYAPPGTDIAKVAWMVLIHDIVEVDAGDTFVYDDPSVLATQSTREEAAADRLFALLPAEQAGAVRGLWDEFEERASQEARFARALDRLQPLLANYRNDGGTWQSHKVTADKVYARVELITEGSPALGAYATALVEDAITKGILAPAT